MKNKIAILILIIVTITLSGCLGSPLNDVNNTLKEINTLLSEGDNAYNQAVTALNNNDTITAETHINTASDKYSECETKMSKIISDNQLNNTIFKQYLNLSLEEIEEKTTATANLRSAYQEMTTNSTLINAYLNKANEHMRVAKKISASKQLIVTKNPQLFTKEIENNFFIF